ncbi:LytTR family DNA-binding domain-containing protein [uncultured Sphingomonas sp.]|uniref:LytTR family DNA-binding domain-containing protein n=1 Tax=uncultured Sphingomonas sp. TaxID=158754 RepID=UPI002614FFFC|nr:LytTR family DNA-binding domain-containing protein [uncultured Sphingomonas sp.]
MPPVRRLVVDLSIMLAIGLLLALLGPFGTFGASFAFRLVYWMALMIAGYAIYHPAMLVASRVAVRLALPEAAMWAAACAVASVPMTAVVWVVGRIGYTRRWPTLEQALALYVNVAVIGAIGTAMLWIARRRREPAAIVEDAEVAAPVGPALLDRLPPGFGPVLHALEMEDHYVRAHGAYGSALILMRMRDAVAETAPLVGAQVHRSWWVARGAVEGVRREGRNYRLVLPGGVEAPVARGAVSALAAEGWI